MMPFRPLVAALALMVVSLAVPNAWTVPTLGAQELPASAVRALEAERWDEAIAVLSSAIQRAPRAAVLLQQRGRAYRESGNLSLALADYNAAIAADSLSGGTYVGRAAVRYRMQDPNAALDDLAVARRRGMRDPQLDLLEGMSYHALGRSAEAITALDRYLAVAPSLATAWYLRGMARLALGDRTGACADGREAAARGDSTAATMVARGC